MYKHHFYSAKRSHNIKNVNRLFCVGYFVLILLISIGICNYFILPKLYSKGDSSFVLHDTASVASYLNKNYKNLKINSTYKKFIPSANIDQDLLNKYYNNFYNITDTKKTVEGTCAEVAVTLLAKSHNINQGSYEYIFGTVMNTAKDNGYWKKNYGTLQASIDSLVTKSFKFWGSSKKGNNDHLNIYSNLVKNIDNGYTSVFSCSNHSMQAVGYATYNIQYTEKILFFINKTTTKNEYFVVVNDGWFNSTNNSENKQYSYYPASLISSITFSLTKVV